MSVSTYAKHFSTNKTPQSSPIPGSNQVPNSAGGFTWAVDDWKRLDRFLVLGNDGGSYYASEKTLTVENAQCVLRCLQTDPVRTVNRIVEISDSGRAPKNDPAIFALALACGQKNKSAAFNEAIYDALPKVCRIGTHLFSFVEAVKQFRGFGRGLRNSIANWYNEHTPKELAFQVTKYQQRNGWGHRDLLRLSHAKADIPTIQEIFHWIVKGWEGVGDDPHPNTDLLPIWAMEKAKRTKDAKEIVKLIQEFGLVREHIPTNFLNDASVWEALLEKMPMTALIRNLATMTRIGLIAPLSKGTAKVVDKLSNADYLRKSRVHPITVLMALKTYASGRGERGQNTWVPVPQVNDALDEAFYACFANVEPTGKRWYISMDVSGSMSSTLAGTPMSCCEGTAALALVTARTEKQYMITAFADVLRQVPITAKSRLSDALQHARMMNFGRTDCSLPMQAALMGKVPVDVFMVLTDNETYAGSIHPSQALQEYRQKMGIPAKLIVNGMVSNGFSIADPNDAGMMDVVGFDSATPQLMAEFAKGEF